MAGRSDRRTSSGLDRGRWWSASRDRTTPSDPPAPARLTRSRHRLPGWLDSVCTEAMMSTATLRQDEACQPSPGRGPMGVHSRRSASAARDAATESRRTSVNPGGTARARIHRPRRLQQVGTLTPFRVPRSRHVGRQPARTNSDTTSSTRCTGSSAYGGTPSTPPHSKYSAQSGLSPSSSRLNWEPTAPPGRVARFPVRLRLTGLGRGATVAGAADQAATGTPGRLVAAFDELVAAVQSLPEKSQGGKSGRWGD